MSSRHEKCLVILSETPGVSRMVKASIAMSPSKTPSASSRTRSWSNIFTRCGTWCGTRCTGSSRILTFSHLDSYCDLGVSIMAPRVDLQALLEDLLRTSSVYFQPPANVVMVYPCIVYHRDTAVTDFANN